MTRITIMNKIGRKSLLLIAMTALWASIGLGQISNNQPSVSRSANPELSKFSHLKNKLVVFLGIGLDPLSPYRNNRRTILFLNSEDSASKNLLNEISQLLNGKNASEISKAIEITGPLVVVVSDSNGEHVLGSIEDDGKITLKWNGNIENLSEVNIGVLVK